MRRSKLEMHFEILEVLLIDGPLKQTHIMYKTNINSLVLKEQLCFLMQNGLVEKKTLRKGKPIFAITSIGKQILSAFNELKEEFQIEATENKQEPLLF
jgi:predicted transcriptional regulator